MPANAAQTGTSTTGRAGMRVLADIMRVNAAQQPDATAIVYGAQHMTYGELDQRTTQVANGLTAAGLSPQIRVAHLDKNADSFYEIFYGTAKSNTVLVSVNWRLTPREIAFIINDAQAEILFVSGAYFDVVEGLRSDLPSVRLIVALDGEHAEWEAYAAWRDRQSTADPHIAVDPSDVATQLYTSGTTGHPKGVQLTNANLMAGLRGSEAYAFLEPADVNLVCMPFFHIAGSAWGNIGLYFGVKNVIVREIVPAEILKLIESERITTTLFVPAVIIFLLQVPAIQTTDLSSMRLIVYGASPIPLDVLRRAIEVFKCDFVQVYGLTETTGTITYLPPEDHVSAHSERLSSCGKPLPSAGIRVVDMAGEGLPAGEVGEILCRGPLIMKGYWNLPEATAAALQDGWLHSGDAGYLDADGYLYIHDRIKDMIISGAENIYPAEIESVLFEHPAIADAAVIGVPDEEWGESVKAIVVKKSEVDVSAAEIVAFARERLATFKAPRSVDFVDMLPRNPSGKILKRELRRPYWEGRERQVN